MKQKKDYWLLKYNRKATMTYEEYKTKYWTTTWKQKFTEIEGNIKL